MKNLPLIFAFFLISACSSTGKTYENKIFPTGEWKPVNQEFIQPISQPIEKK